MKFPVARLLQALMLAGALSACDRKPAASTAPAGRPVIIVSIFPLQSIVQQLTGEWADVEALMPPGASPHDFEPTASQLAPLSKADLLIVIGLNLDAWAEKASERIGPHDLEVEHMADLVGEGGSSAASRAVANQHLWMDPVRVIQFVEALTPKLQKKYPAHSADIELRKQTLVSDLRSMDDQFRRDLASVREKKLISYHNAYDLLADRYGLQVIAHLTDIDLSPGGEVTANDLVETLEAVKRYHLKVIYSEPQFPGRAVDMIHEQAGVAVLSLDDLGGPSRPGYDSYQALMKSDVKVLVEGQSR